MTFDECVEAALIEEIVVRLGVCVKGDVVIDHSPLLRTLIGSVCILEIELPPLNCVGLGVLEGSPISESET